MTEAIGYVACINLECSERGIAKVIVAGDEFLLGMSMQCGVCGERCVPDPAEANGPPS